MGESKITCGVFLYDAINKKILGCRPTGARKLERLSIPKGIYEEGIDDDFLSAAYRECIEETNFDPSECEFVKEFELVPYEKSQKKLKSFLVISHTDLSQYPFICKSFFISKREGIEEELPEISEFLWLSMEEAKERLHPTQSCLLPKILNLL